MSKNFPEYLPFFSKGLRIEIGIPQPSGDIFRDWAIIREFHEDTILVQLSRDYLPADVKVEINSILDASIRIDQQIYTCTCIVTERQGERNLRIRLFGLLTLKERRQFFRLECTFNFRYTDPDQRLREEVAAEWQTWRELELMRLQGCDEYCVAARQAEQMAAQPGHIWHESRNFPVVLGGGGMGFKLDTRLKPESLLHMELYLPLSPPRTIRTVAEVAYVLDPVETLETSAVHYRTGFKFVHLEGRDRDDIFHYISQMQLLRLREISENRPFQSPYEKENEQKDMDWERVLLRILYVLVVIAICLWIGRKLMEYRQRGDTNEIKVIYEKSLKKYRKEY
ncbi:PilZ-like domain-containing protein [Geotalea sp. SG265]|uniref:PilZ-like domain-containing protein n=1 Tax=Geotalea sp. SG265 TaxID=2922867 RepID=UPI001FAF81AF|nr:PilZ-like domain-containing protein [Geotalea sp. SG265]